MTDSVRLDIWLWRARFWKTRSAAADDIRAHGIRITRHGQTQKVTKPHFPVRTGDIVVFLRANALRVVVIDNLGTRRGPPAEARSLYADETAPPGQPSVAGAGD